MNRPTTYKSHTSSTKGECCTESKCESGLRNNYFDGKRLTTDSFSVEQTYMQGRRHLLNRAIHGWGVVYGYELSQSYSQRSGTTELKIGPGLALDKCGRELLETGTSIQFEDVILVDGDYKRIALDDLLKSIEVMPGFSWEAPPKKLIDALEKKCALLSVHYAERDASHVLIEDRCRCERDEWDHLCETVYYSIQLIDCNACCKPPDCELQCECATGECCEEPKEGEIGPDPVPPARQWHQRGGCECLCHYLTTLTVGSECDTLCEIEGPCGNVRVDSHNGVPLACIRLEIDKCGFAFGPVSDACGPRRLIKRNDLLFDLIRGCDLTYIKNYGWKAWHRHPDPILFPDFADAFAQVTPGVHEDEYVTRDFWVEFSRPVRRETVKDSFVMNIITVEGDDWWWETSRVPITNIKETEDFITRATIKVDGTWLESTIRGNSSRLQGWPTRVEIEIRGDFIVDCNGQTVDANAHGLSKGPTGNGTPGGTFISTFPVAKQESPGYQTSTRSKGVS